MHHRDRHTQVRALLRVATDRRLYPHRQEGVVHQRDASSSSGSSRKHQQAFSTQR
jgi:hypothetical protein